MNRNVVSRILVVVLGGVCCICGLAFANGGPFVVRYPSGDPAAKGVLARLNPDLKPARETRLRVVKEDLKIVFDRDPRDDPPTAQVSAEYTIKNPTKKDIEVDFGFPILRGIRTDPSSMMIQPDVRVSMKISSGWEHVRCDVISNSVIYGLIRRRARTTIDRAVAHDKTLAKLVANVRKSSGPARDRARKKLSAHLTGRSKRWNGRDAALMVEYAGLDWGKKSEDRSLNRFSIVPWEDKEMRGLYHANLSPIRPIGEQKATQFLAQLASKFDPKAASTYESIFAAWGGDVRERSVDLRTGKIRPREITVDSNPRAPGRTAYDPSADPTVYARVDYLNNDSSITAQERATCKAILKNLPVVFTFAPMNLLHYRVKFPAGSTQTLRVNYSQYAYADTKKPDTYQLCYVVHPASLWKDFGRINLEVEVPKGVRCRASVPCTYADVRKPPSWPADMVYQRKGLYKATINRKTGELFVAVSSDSWKQAFTIPKLEDVQPKAVQVAAPKGKS